MERNIDKDEIILYLHKNPIKRLQILSNIVSMLITDYPSHPCELGKYSIEQDDWYDLEDNPCENCPVMPL